MAVLLLALRHGDASLDAVLGINEYGVGGGGSKPKKRKKSNEMRMLSKCVEA